MTTQKTTWPDSLSIRATNVRDDLGGMGQQIYTTAGQGVKQLYIRADVADEAVKDMKHYTLLWALDFAEKEGVEYLRQEIDQMLGKN